jgi:hypothetical protein
MAFDDLLAAADRALLSPLGSTISYTPDGGYASEIQGIFDAAFLKISAGNAGVISSGPAVFVLLEDLPEDPEDGDPTIEIDSEQYSVREVDKDGKGGAVLHLHKI